MDFFFFFQNYVNFYEAAQTLNVVNFIYFSPLSIYICQATFKDLQTFWHQDVSAPRRFGPRRFGPKTLNSPRRFGTIDVLVPTCFGTR